MSLIWTRKTHFGNALVCVSFNCRVSGRSGMAIVSRRPAGSHSARQKRSRKVGHSSGFSAADAALLVNRPLTSSMACWVASQPEAKNAPVAGRETTARSRRLGFLSPGAPPLHIPRTPSRARSCGRHPPAATHRAPSRIARIIAEARRQEIGSPVAWIVRLFHGRRLGHFRLGL